MNGKEDKTMFKKLSQQFTSLFGQPTDINKVLTETVAATDSATAGVNRLMTAMEEVQSDCEKVALDMSAYFRGAGKAVEVPKCMVLVIEHLWRHKIKTLRSYCCDEEILPGESQGRQAIIVIEDIGLLFEANEIARQYPRLNLEVMSA